MLLKIKLAAVFLGGLALAVMYALLQKSEKERAEMREKIKDKSHAIQMKASLANLEGVVDEHEAMTKPIDDKKDDGF